MRPVQKRRRKLTAVGLAAIAGAVIVIGAVIAVHAQQPFEFFIFAVDKDNLPVLDLKETDLSMKESQGEGHILSVRRFGWPVKVTILLDTGAKTTNSLQHVRKGLTEFFEGIPKEVPVSLVTTAPSPRFLLRDEKDPIKIKKAITLVVPEAEDGGAYGRFADSLVEYAHRLDDEFRDVGPEQLPPYLPILIVISTTTQDGSSVRKEDNIQMILSLRKHHVWTNFVMITPSKSANITDDGSQLTIEPDEAQIGELANACKDNTGGRYFALGGSGVSGLATTILPDLAQDVTVRYIKQMTQHRVLVERSPDAKGPVKDLGVVVNRAGVKFDRVARTAAIP